VMEGYLQLRINPWLRRLLTRLLAIIPSLIVIIFFGEKNVDALLIGSQVVLSAQLGFVIIPLIHFVSDKKLMGKFSITPLVKAIAWIVAAILIYLNVKLVYEGIAGFFSVPGNTMIKIIIVLAALFLAFLLCFVFFHPAIAKKQSGKSIQIHPELSSLQLPEVPEIKSIAIALDFSAHDEKLIAYAMKQGGENSKYILIHVVESASARMLGKNSDDFETRQDEERLSQYGNQLEQKGLVVTTRLGYQKRAKEIVRIVKEENAGMLVIGAHGHAGIKDLIYGQTVEAVRHELNIPVLVIHY
jgi:manganese transport protein